jgi:hypothetical protein
MPNLQQNAFPVFTPLTIPKSQLLNVLRQKKFFAHDVTNDLAGQPMSKSIQFNGQTAQRAIEIKGILADGMLAAKLESGKPSCAQHFPKLLFFFGLHAAKTPCIRSGRVHDHTLGTAATKSNKSNGLLSMSVPRFREKGFLPMNLPPTPSSPDFVGLRRGKRG